jgi:hypothetical protein
MRDPELLDAPPVSHEVRDLSARSGKGPGYPRQKLCQELVNHEQKIREIL